MAFLFVVGDILSFGLQIAGTVLRLVIDHSGVGTSIIAGGFALHIISFCCFITLTFVFEDASFAKGFHTWKSNITAFHANIVLFFIRNVFRLVEYAQRWNEYIFCHVAFVYNSTTILLVPLILT